MSALRSLLDEMALVADDDLTIAELDGDLVELSHIHQQTEVLLARKARNLADRDGHHMTGHPSLTAYLIDRLRMTAGRARRFVTRVLAAETAPASFAAWSDGRISTDQADVLFQAANGVPDQFPEAEERLVDIIEPLSVSDTARAVEYWRQSVDGPGELTGEEQMIRRGFSLTKTIWGMRRADGWLTPAVGEAFEAAIAANMAPPRPRTPARQDNDVTTPSQTWPGTGSTTPTHRWWVVSDPTSSSTSTSTPSKADRVVSTKPRTEASSHCRPSHNWPATPR